MCYLMRDQDDTPAWTFGTGGKDGRYGGAHQDGTVNLHAWGPNNEAMYSTSQCSSYRKAQRKLRQWLKGYNV